MESDIGTSLVEGLTPAASSAPEAVPVAASEPVAPLPLPEPTVTTPATTVAQEPTAVTPAPVEAVKPEFVPLPAFLDMRDENKKLKAELAKLKEQPTQPASPPPSFQDDPEAYAAHLQDQITARVIDARFDWSEEVAREKYGTDAVEAAKNWGLERAGRSKAFANEYLLQKNPIAWIVQQHKQQQLMADIGSDPDAFVRKRAAELGFVAATALQTPPQPQAIVAAASPTTPVPVVATHSPTRSLASVPSAGGPNIVPTGPFAAFEGLTPG